MDLIAEPAAPPTKKETQKAVSEKIKKLMRESKIMENVFFGSHRRFRMKKHRRARA
jgi:hypothetical protein